MPRRVTMLAPAKINPWLAVLARRPDGYHEVDTCLCALELSDRLTLEPSVAGSIELELVGPAATSDVPADGQNLAMRALERALSLARARGAVGERDGVRLRLEKHVPSRAGLGGGSSDAAAAFVGFELLYGIDLGMEDRERELALLGSDCAFFAVAHASGLARCTGRGERVETLAPPAQPWFIVVVVPAVGTSTREVYGALDSLLSHRTAFPNVPLTVFREPASRARSRLFNDLEEAAARVLPDWTKWREALDSVGASHFRLSGSGSSFFGLFDEEEEARSVLARLLQAVAARGLTVRGSWLTRPSRRGVHPLEILLN